MRNIDLMLMRLHNNGMINEEDIVALKTAVEYTISNMESDRENFTRRFGIDVIETLIEYSE